MISRRSLLLGAGAGLIAANAPSAGAFAGDWWRACGSPIGKPIAAEALVDARALLAADRGFLQGMTQVMAETIWYGDPDAEPLQFTYVSLFDGTA